MSRRGKTIRINTKEWEKATRPYVEQKEHRWRKFPDLVMHSALHDIRQHDFGVWALAQVYRFQCGMKVDPATMASEGFEWEFYGDVCRIIDAFDESRYFEIPLEDFASALRGIRASGYAEEGVEITFLEPSD